MSRPLRELSNRVLGVGETKPTNYILLLDYSKSMSQGGKIENSIKAILKIWDEFI